MRQLYCSNCKKWIDEPDCSMGGRKRDAWDSFNHKVCPICSHSLSKDKPFHPESSKIVKRDIPYSTWYSAYLNSPKMEQIVIDPGPVLFEESGRRLIFSQRYVRIYQNRWIVILNKFDDDDTPALVIKANESTDFLKDHYFQIGFSLIKGRHGNLFALFVEFEGPYPYNCPTKPLIVFEDVLGLDCEEMRNEILKCIDTDCYHVFLVEGGSATVEGDRMVAKPVEVKYQALIKIRRDCRDKLMAMTRQHFTEHLNIGERNWDFQKSINEFVLKMPIQKQPLLPKPGTNLFCFRSNTNPKVRSLTKNFLDPNGEIEADHVVIFVRGDPNWRELPQPIKSYLDEQAKECGIVITDKTTFQSYRKSEKIVDDAQQGQNIELIAVMELAGKLGTKMQMVDDYHHKKLLAKELYCPRSGSFLNRSPDCAIVIICTSGTTAQKNDIPDYFKNAIALEYSYNNDSTASKDIEVICKKISALKQVHSTLQQSNLNVLLVRFPMRESKVYAIANKTGDPLLYNLSISEKFGVNTEQIELFFDQVSMENLLKNVSGNVIKNLEC